MRVKEIAQLILYQTGSRSRLEHQPLPQDDPKRRKPVIERAIGLLGWQRRVPLGKGVRATFDYFSLKVAMPDSVVGTDATPLRVRPLPRRGSVTIADSG